MLLNKDQKNPINYKEMKVTVNENYLNAMHIYCSTPVTTADLIDYIGDATNLSPVEASKMVEEGIKNEIISLSGEEVWDKVFNEYVEKKNEGNWRYHT